MELEEDIELDTEEEESEAVATVATRDAELVLDSEDAELVLDSADGTDSSEVTATLVPAVLALDAEFVFDSEVGIDVVSGTNTDPSPYSSIMVSCSSSDSNSNVGNFFITSSKMELTSD